jgi:hypothetical protein
MVMSVDIMYFLTAIWRWIRKKSAKKIVLTILALPLLLFILYMLLGSVVYIISIHLEPLEQEKREQAWASICVKLENEEYVVDGLLSGIKMLDHQKVFDEMQSWDFAGLLSNAEVSDDSDGSFKEYILGRASRLTDYYITLTFNGGEVIKFYGWWDHFETQYGKQRFTVIDEEFNDEIKKLAERYQVQ